MARSLFPPSSIGRVPILALLTLAACSQPERNSQTLYLASADSYLPPTDSHSRHTPAPIKKVSTTGGSTPTPAPSPRLPTHTVPMIEEPLLQRRSHLLGWIEQLSNDEADAVCLTLELIPREQVFDRHVNPRKLLLHHTSQVTTAAELDSIEQAINELRR